jgi:hypothetical protein
MKIQRPGHTETQLLYSNFLKKHHSILYNKHIEHFFIKWLYTTSGFYDKSVSLNDIETIINSDCYNTWIQQYDNALYNCDHIECCIGNPTFDDLPPEHLEEYLLKFKSKSLTINKHYITKSNTLWNQYWCLEGKDANNNYKGVFSQHYNLLVDKNVLVISPFSELVEYQHKNNVNKLFHGFPKFNLITFTTPYTFLNTGPHNNFFETLNFIYDQISLLNFDIVLLSCGTYAALLIEKINTLLNKDAIYMGRGCNYMFGIDPQRDITQFPDWIINIPDRMIPYDFNKIEDGIYWKKQTQKET